MNKDVIYIDVDDDVTAIIGKIKKSKEKVVALVPPKRAGSLQSAVNLRLLNRMAKADKKHLVLITNNQALMALAANSKIPVAKNLQSKPELPEIPALAVDDDDDIIDGSDLPVGDHAATVKVSDNTRTDSRSDVIESLDIDGEKTATAGAVGVSHGVSKRVASARSKVKIPDFNSFRKRLALVILGGAGLIALLIWMFVFAPAATIVITAKTSPAPVSSTIKLGGTAATDYKAGILKSVSQQEKKDVSIDFDATGTGTVGEKATGTVVFKNCEDSVAITIPAGTTISKSGQNYVTQTAVSVPGGSGGFGGCTTPGTSGAVAISAADIGSQYDTADGSTFAVSGHPNSSTVYMRAVASGAISGGSSREVKIVSAEDIDRAKGQLIGQSTDADKKSLAKKFVNGEKIIDSSFTVDRVEAVSVPAVNAEAPASGKAKLTIATTYTLYAVPKADLESYLNSSITAQLDSRSSQKIYNTGIDKATLSNFRKEGDVLMATVTSTGQVGPKIDEDSIKDKVKGKIYGEVQSTIEAIDGVQGVDVLFSFPWVRSVPRDTTKIQIEFKLQDEG
ncbi:MAG: hypothetical protein WAO28_01475 [Candidatus Microsaccharimonas sp.]